MRLEGAAAILTGASRGIGVTLAEQLARRGVDLALAARSKDELDRVADRIRALGAKVIAVPTDVTSRTDLENLVRQVQDELGSIDLLINNAGIERYAYFHEVDPEIITSIINTNVIAPEILTRLVLPGMIERRRGHIVNISSVAGKTAVPYNTVYSSSKHALVGFSWSLREEMKPFGIGVSVICPTYISGAGMFHDWSRGEAPPSSTRSVTPAKVAAKTIHAIEKDVAEVIVAKGLAKIVDVTHAISPAVTTALARRLGSYRFMEKAVGKRQRD